MNSLIIMLIAVGVFIFIVLALVGLILLAKSYLVPVGTIKININDDPDYSFDAPVGGKLLNTLDEKEIYLPSAFGAACFF